MATHRFSRAGPRSPRLAWALLALLVLGACAARAPGPTRVPVSPPGGPWQYEVTASPGAEELSAMASFPASSDSELSVEQGAEPFVRDVEVLGDSGWAPVAPRGTSWIAPACANGCRVRYRYRLAEAARELVDLMLAAGRPGSLISPPSTWLLRPVHAEAGTAMRFHVTPAPGDSFVSGVFAPADAPAGTYEAHTAGMFQLPYSAFGKLRIHELHEGAVTMAILPGALRHEDDVVAWANTAAGVVARFYGRPPVPHTLVLIHPVRRLGAGSGTTMGHSGAAIVVDVGEDSSQADLKDDWVLVHEMIHTALPDILGPQHWLEEGLATYVEPLARERFGLRKPEDVWAEWVHGMPQGLPREGDEGLDRTPTWGRTYWGGALFCLVADVTIRERTKGKKSLDDALRAVDAASGGLAHAWPVERVVEVGDAATGVPVLHELYAKMADAPAPVDLPALWKKLGVIPNGQGVKLDDGAQLASVRRAMTP